MNDRLERIDVLRGVAILLVVLRHFYVTVVPSGTEVALFPVLGNWQSWLFIPAEVGYLGVQLFFVLSGFCIHNSYLSWRRKPPDPTWRSFLLNYFNRRFWRIYPPYFIVLVLTFTWAYWPNFDARAFRHLAFHASLTNTLSPAFFYNINVAFWSIAVECQLYVLYPALLWLSLRWGLWQAVGLASVISCFWYFILPLLTDNFALLNLPFHWWFEWCLGFLVAELRSRGRMPFPKPVLFASVLLPAAALSFKFDPRPYFHWLLPPLGFAALLQAACASPRPLRPVEHWLCVVGISSYSLYLLHNPILWVTSDLLKRTGNALPPWTVWLVIFPVMLSVMQWVSRRFFHWVEQPSIDVGKTIERGWRANRPSGSGDTISLPRA